MQDPTTKTHEKKCIWKRSTSMIPKWQVELPAYSEEKMMNGKYTGW